VAEAIFVDGVPAKITIYDFRRHHLQSFPALADNEHDALIADAIDTIYSMFPYVGKVWNWQPKQIWFDKTVLCYRLLTAWYIADLYPAFVSGVPVMGGIPIKRKKVDGVDIMYADSSIGSNDMLESLKSNPWGNKALMMIRTAVKRTLLRNSRFV
jgi:hypothetical protein